MANLNDDDLEGAVVERIDDHREEKDRYKPKVAELYWIMTNVVDNWTPGADPADKLAHRWIMVEVSRGGRIPHVVTPDNTLVEMDIEVLSRDIAEYIKGLDPLAMLKKLSPKQQAECARFVVMTSKLVIPLESVQKIAWKSEPVWTFARLPFDRAVVMGDYLDVIRESCPVFSEFLSRFESPKQAGAFCAWVGSLMLDRQNDIHRGVILYGEGRNGKSTFLNFLRAIFGVSMIYKNCGKGDKFATDGMERARIIAFADVNDKDLFVDALVKGMIGGDSIEINAKSVRQFQSRPKAKMIACTNVMPNIRDNIAEKRRWIFCSVAGFDGITDPLYQSKLDSEAEWIFGCCCEAFETIREGNDIIVDDDCLSAVTDAAEYDVSFFCDRHFERAGKDTVFPSHNIAAIREHTRSKVTTDRIIKYLVKHYGADTVRVCKNNMVIRCIRGVRMKTSALNAVNCSNTADTLTGD
jgi:hypothetical protein